MHITLQALLACALAVPPTMAAQSNSAPLKIGGDVKPPVLIKQVDPKYPRPIFFGKAKEGEVLVHLIVDEKGVPAKLTVQKSDDKKLADAAMKAVSQYRFKPATKDDVPVAVELNVAVKFQIQ